MNTAIDRVAVRALELPTAGQPETDGTATWSSTTMVLVEISAGGVTGIGFSYVHAVAAKLVADLLSGCVEGTSALAIPELHARMARAVRNHGRPGIAACAISAVDVALWDLKARLFDVPLADLLGCARDRVPVYASGGFTSTSSPDLAREIEGYVAAGHKRVKIKIGQPLESAIERVVVARSAAGSSIELMVDANGAYTGKQAIELAGHLRELGVDYFEEPVSSDDRAGLHLVRERCAQSIAAGEYGYDTIYFRTMLESQCVDILQADATRCGGITGFMRADALCEASCMPLSAHCAPSLHVHPGRAAQRLIHVEAFFDHVRFESLLFDGVPVVEDGALISDARRPGLGLSVRADEAKYFAA